MRTGVEERGQHGWDTKLKGGEQPCPGESPPGDARGGMAAAPCPGWPPPQAERGWTCAGSSAGGAGNAIAPPAPNRSASRPVLGRQPVPAGRENNSALATKLSAVLKKLFPVVLKKKKIILKKNDISQSQAGCCISSRGSKAVQQLNQLWLCKLHLRHPGRDVRSNPSVTNTHKSARTTPL